MNRSLLLLLVSIFFAKSFFAQAITDSVPVGKNDSIKQQRTIVGDSIKKKAILDTSFKKTAGDSLIVAKKDSNTVIDSQTRQLIVQQLNSKKQAESRKAGITQKATSGKELLFYSLILLFLLFAFLRNLFSKYFNDLFRLFFRTTLKQRQIKEQLMQTPLPSLIFNCFFIITTALYIDLLLQHFNLLTGINFWLLFFYCFLALSIIYFLKYLGLKISGWLFDTREAADSYVFIVFVVNKMTGIYLLPFLVLLSFSQDDLYKMSFTISWIGVVALLGYRIILTYSAVHNQIKVNFFHFFIYLCAFEIAPLLILYKSLSMLLFR